QFRKGFLQRDVKVILECQLCRRCQDASIDTIRLAISIFRNKLYLPGCGRPPALRPIVKPVTQREQDEDKYEDYGNVVLPCTTLVRPEKRLRQDLAEAGHVSPRARRRRSRHHACAPHDQSRWWPPDCE